MGAIDAIFALAIAFIFYGAGPLYLASERKKPIRKLHYWLFCVLYDAVVFIALQLITGSSISPVNLAVTALLFGTIFYFVGLRFLYKGIIIKHNKTEPTYTKTSLFLCEKRRFFMARTEKGVVATI